MRVELVGLPGVGKTSILQALEQQHPEFCAKYYVKKFSDDRRNFFRDGVFLLKKRTVLRYLLLQQECRFALLKLLRVARRERALQRKDNFILVDSGLLQPIIELYIQFNHFTKVDWEHIFSWQVRDHDYFFIHDNIEKIVERELRRQPRHFTFDRARLTQEYLRCEQFLRKLLPQSKVREFHMSEYQDPAAVAQAIYLILTRGASV